MDKYTDCKVESFFNEHYFSFYDWANDFELNEILSKGQTYDVELVKSTKILYIKVLSTIVYKIKYIPENLTRNELERDIKIIKRINNINKFLEI